MNFARAIAILALAVSVVTAAVTIGRTAPGGSTTRPAGEYQVVITNLATGTKHPWAIRQWPDQNRCDAALGNLNAAVRAIAGDGEMPDHFTGSDQELMDSVDRVVNFIYQNTGILPNLSISCELTGDPA